MLFELLTEKEKEMMLNYIDAYAGGRSEDQNSLDYILRYWEKNKQDLFKLLGNKLIYSVPYSGREPEERLILKVKDAISGYGPNKAISNLYDKLYNAIHYTTALADGTPFTIGMVAETKPTTFAELVKISGLSHGTDVWLGNASDLCTPDQDGNIRVPFKDVIGCRDDIMVYLMYHGVKPIKAFKIMEFVRKGKASKDPETWKTHRETMEEAGIEEWFIDSCQKIKYMFPKAHAAAYVISAFRIAWYKVHMPAYFYASWFSTKATDFDIEAMIKGYDAIKERIIEIKNKGYDATNKESGVQECLNVALEMAARNIKVAPFDLYKSKGTIFTVEDDNTLIPPFITIDGLGEVVAKNIEVEASKRPFISVEDFQNRCKVSQTLIDKMRTMGLFKGMSESSQLSLFDFEV